jgi:endoglucanase
MKNKAIVLCLMFIMAACSNNGTPSQTREISEEIETATLTPSPEFTSDLQQLQVVGNKIVNDNGEVVILRGLGPQQIINLATTDFDIPWNEELFQTIHEWGATVVRLLVTPGRFFEDEERGLEVLDQAIEWAGKHDMYVIINYNASGFPPTGYYSHNSSSVEVSTEAEMIRFWQTISARYAGIDQVAFYEIMNEASSHPWNGQTYLEDWLTLKNFSELVIDLIREKDPDTIVLVSGLKWASVLSHTLHYPIQRNNVAYTMHFYPSTSNDWDQSLGTVAEQYPVFLTETSFGTDVEGEYSWINESEYKGDQPFRFALMDYLEEHGISWIAVAFSALWEPGLIQDQMYNPTEVGEFFREQLQNQEWKVTTGEVISQDQGVFAGAIGKWESIDPADSGKRTLTITSLSDYTYSVRYEDSAVPLCGVNNAGVPLYGASGVGEGNAFYQKLDIGPIYLDCSDGQSIGGLLFDSFLYDSEVDKLTDLIGTVWSRIESITTNLPASEFTGATGEWTSLDGSDGSNQTLIIENLGSNRFSIIYTDESASICETDSPDSATIAAIGEGSGEATSNNLSVTFQFTCQDETESLSDQYSIVFEYNTSMDSISDTFSNAWNRIE